jgi:4-amino-4-deoxy-L-arabinose transferase-like glycosyltransferase
MNFFNGRLAWIGLFCLVAIPIFLHLDKQPIRIWDEARLSINAYEMNRNGNLLVTHFEGAPDMWNTKPPLMIWLQVLFIKILGFNELALRLPSAIAALLTCVVMAVFSKRCFKDALPGMIACMVLVTANGYINIHASRTGDYDALLALFTTLFSLSMFLYVETRALKYLHVFFGALTLAVLTKSVQGLLFLPAIGLYVLLNRRDIFKSKWLYIDLGLFLLIAGGYYLLREQYNPGYLRAVWENELGGRYLDSLEDNKQPAEYYVQQLKDWLFKPWIWLSIAGVFAGYFSKYRKFTFFITLLSATYLLFISLSQTKLEWYTVPLFPFLSFLAAMLLVRITAYLQAKHVAVAVAFLALVFIYPYLQIGRKVYNPTEYEWDKEIYPVSYFLQDALRENVPLNNHVLCYWSYKPLVLPYLKALEDKGQHVRFGEVMELKAGDMVIAGEPDVKYLIEGIYDTQLVKEYNEVRIYKILGIKT